MEKWGTLEGSTCDCADEDDIATKVRRKKADQHGQRKARIIFTNISLNECVLPMYSHRRQRHNITYVLIDVRIDTVSPPKVLRS
jgi:hypothetical protein